MDDKEEKSYPEDSLERVPLPSEQQPPEPEKVVLTVDRKGNIANAAELPPELLAQLSTPEAQAQIQKMYRDAHPRTTRKEVRQQLQREPKQEQRCFSAIKPPGMSNRQFAKIRRAQFRTWSKETLKIQRRMRNVPHESAGSESDLGHSAQPGEQLGNSPA